MGFAHARSRLLLGSALVVTSLFTYGRSADAACTVTVSPTYECSGANAATQSILNVTDATVSTLPGFSVNAAAGNGIEISGDGAISFTDVNNSTITSGPTGLTTHGLEITGLGAGAGTVTVDINSIVTGAVHAISAVNNGIGALSIAADGNLTGNSGYGIYARQNIGAGLQITTGVDASILGSTVGIRAFHDGTGNMLIDTSGDVTGTANYGIDAINYAGTTNLTVNTGALTQVTGGEIGIQAKNYGTGMLSITANGDVTGTATDGISALNYGTDLNVTSGIGSKIEGWFAGIRALNEGSGNLTILANGDVNAIGLRGILAINGSAGINLNVTTGVGTEATGGTSGISARNLGTGALAIVANGDATGNSHSGIYARNSGTDLSVTTGIGTTTSSGVYGIWALNEGSGALAITANGDVTGTTGLGIYARNASSGTDLTMTTGPGTTVSGVKGIDARGFGTGVLSITANGDVTGTGSQGIFAEGHSFGTDLTVTTSVGTTVLGDTTGIFMRHYGSGVLEITANGDVTGTSGTGVLAISYGSGLTVTTGAGSTITGAGSGVNYGIFARNKGSGALEITANGAVTGTGFEGIHASNSATGTDVTVTTGAGTLISGQRGIYAHNSGLGALEITVNGDVTSTNLGAIYASNDLIGSDLTVTTGVSSTVAGATYGIEAANQGNGTLGITVGGLVSTTSLNPTGAAILAFGNGVTIDNLNTGYIIGRVTTGGGDDVFTNAGVWESKGLSDFGAGTNTITNSGSVRTSFTGGTAESTLFANAGTFSNASIMSLSDETAGNGSQAHDQLTIDGDFVGGGTLLLDAYLGGPGSTADLLIVTGNVSGVTQLQVINTSSGGGATNLDGIALVQVNGTSAAGDFVLVGGPISAGLFTYDLQFDVGNSVHELVSTGAAAVSAELATFASAAQSIWYDTLGVLDERFDELHKDIRSAAIISDDTLVQPVSYSPSAQTGLWGKFIGRMSDRNATSSVGGVAADISYGLDTAGLVLGVDGALDSTNGSLALGVTGGYVTADQGFDSGSTANYEGFTGGLYATYVNGNFHVNGQLKANALDLDYTMAGTSGTSEGDVLSLGGALEAGYRLDMTDHLYAEPVAQVAYVDSSTHNGDALGTAFSANGDSLRGAIGLNVGGQINGSGVIFKPELTLRVWGEFEGDNSASFSTFTVADNTPDVFGEASIGIEALSLSNGWSGNMKGDIQFAEDFSSFGGFVGLRKSF